MRYLSGLNPRPLKVIQRCKFLMFLSFVCLLVRLKKLEKKSMRKTSKRQTSEAFLLNLFRSLNTLSSARKREKNISAVELATDFLSSTEKKRKGSENQQDCYHIFTRFNPREIFPTFLYRFLLKSEM